MIDVNLVRRFDVLFAEIADESVGPYPCDYLPTLFLIIRVVKYFLFLFALRVAITLQVACLRQLPSV